MVAQLISLPVFKILWSTLNIHEETQSFTQPHNPGGQPQHTNFFRNYKLFSSDRFCSTTKNWGQPDRFWVNINTSLSSNHKSLKIYHKVFILP